VVVYTVDYQAHFKRFKIEGLDLSLLDVENRPRESEQRPRFYFKFLVWWGETKSIG
jgi:hypothetical protein